MQVTAAGFTHLHIDQYPGLAMYPLGGHTPGSTLFAAAAAVL